MLRWFAVLAVLFSGCEGSSQRIEQARRMTGGDPARGKVAIRRYGCDACHSIPGIGTAAGTVGPPLNHIGERTQLAGKIENTPENLMRWIRFPHSINEKTAMPDMRVTEADGRDIAAYLYTLR